MSDTQKIEMIETGKLRVSDNNPRKTVNEAALAELTKSVMAYGILQPVLVRKIAGGCFEIVAGYRRVRAAQAAELKTVPAIVLSPEFTHLQEVRIIENLQREDIHPLEEAEAYGALMRDQKMPVELLSVRVGKTLNYVYDRLQLLALCGEARTIFRNGEITVGHAILLARLNGPEQKRVIDGGLFQREEVLFTPGVEGVSSRKAVSVKELQAWIDEHVRFVAAKADEMLFPETTKALTVAAEKKEKIVQITHDHYVQPSARDKFERTIGPRSWKRADGKNGSKKCGFAVVGVVVVGPERGDAFRVCLAKKECKAHWAEEMKWAAQRAKMAASGKEPADRQQDEWEQRRKKEEALREQWKAALPAIMGAVIKAIQKLPIKPSGILCKLILNEMPNNNFDRKALRKAVPIGKTTEEFVRHIALLVVANLACNWDAFEQFPKLAAEMGIDIEKILAAGQEKKDQAGDDRAK